MPKCANQHESSSLFCPVCGKPVGFREASAGLARLPEVRPSVERWYSLSVGFPAPELAGAHPIQVNASSKGGYTADLFSVQAAETGTWFNYYSSYSRELRRWLTLLGFAYPQERFVFLDTTDPLSVLCLTALDGFGETIVFGIVADETSTMVDQNTSYCALKTIEKLQVPTILATKSFVSNLVGFFENQGLLAKEEALKAVFSFILGASPRVLGMMKKDQQLGVSMHCISATISGSRMVFPSPREAMDTQMGQRSLKVSDEDVQSFYLASAAKGDQQREIGEAFRTQSRRFGSAMSMDQFMANTDSKYDLYTMVSIYGIQRAGIYESIEKGYDRIAQRSGTLREEMIK